MIGRVTHLPVATEIPAPDELVVPIFQDHTDNALRMISVAELAQLIRSEVLAGRNIEMIETDRGS